MPLRLKPWWAAMVLLCLNAAGCASGRYVFGKADTADEDCTRVVSRGGAAPRLDRFERFLESPTRLSFIPDARPDVPSEETLAELERYLDQNGIRDLTIAIDEYSPASQWSRLKQNRQMSAFWRYPLGTISCAFSAIIPDRVFDRTAYNPYTNTLVVNCDERAAILAAAAYAKDIRMRNLRGGYALMASLPVVSIIHGVDATSDVLSYARHEEDWELEQLAYRELYPRLGAEGAVAVLTVPSIFLRPMVTIGGGLVGRSVAEVQIRRLEKERGVSPPSLLPADSARPLLAAEAEDRAVRVTTVDAVFSDEESPQRVVFPEAMDSRRVASPQRHRGWEKREIAVE